MVIQKILRVIKENQTFLVLTHIHPDPDALASQLAMGLFLKAMGKKVIMLSAEETPKRYMFLPESRKIKKVGEKTKIQYDVAILLDCGDISRIGALQKIIDSHKLIINIDHHITNAGFGNLNLVVPEASSTAEIMFHVLKKVPFKLTRDMAFLLYLGIMTDTGSFRYDNTTAHVHDIVAELMQFDFSIMEVYQKMYECVPLKDFVYFMKVINTFSILCEGKIIFVDLPRRVLRKFSDSFDVKDKIFRFLRTIKGVEILAIFTEESKHRTRVTMRSQNKMDVAKLASKFNGGGHSKASGCFIDSDIKTSRRKLLQQIRKVL